MDCRSCLIKEERILIRYYKIMNHISVKYFHILFSAFTEMLENFILIF
jgi:hypothetical protein